jgi:hypothetical protein
MTLKAYRHLGLSGPSRAAAALDQIALFGDDEGPDEMPDDGAKAG